MVYNLYQGVRPDRRNKFLLAAVSVVSAAVLFVGFAMHSAFAATNTVVVTPPVNSQGWSTADTTAGGTVSFVNDSTAPAGTGALQLTTDVTTAAKAQYMHAANVPLNQVTDLSYYTKQVAASSPVGDPSYQLAVNLNGTSGFTTLVYEPYWNGVVTPGVWQNWNVAQGQFWSSKTVTCSGGVILAGAGGPPLYTLQQVETMCPEATVTGFGVNVGSYNPSYVVETDLVNFNGTTYDFETKPVAATDKDQCKDGGWQNFQANYKNQGQCVSSVVSNRDH